MIRYECPNGHAFDSAVTVPCPDCDARVTCVPLARLIEQGGEIERLRAALAEWADSLEHYVPTQGSSEMVRAVATEMRALERSVSGGMET